MNDQVHTMLATGFTAVTVEENSRRFWIAVNTGNSTWHGGHTLPHAGVLPTAAGKFILAANGLVLLDSSEQRIGAANGFNGLTGIGNTGTGAIENPPNSFVWTSV